MGKIRSENKYSLRSTILIILAGSTMIAHGLRMMSQGLFYPNSIYPAPVPTSIDFWFDWFTLCLFGIIILFIGWNQWKKVVLKKKKNSSENLPVIRPT
jgi:hypothetical protein